MRCLLILLFITLCSTSVFATVVPNTLFSDGAVLQREMPVSVYGTASDGEKITVKFRHQQVATVAQAGKWMVKLRPMRAGGPDTLTIIGDNTVEVKNVLVGEVWVSSGQSNMVYKLANCSGADAVIADSNDSMLRLLTVPFLATKQPQETIQAEWQVSNPASSREFSGVAYYFARELRKALGVPVGIVNAAVDGTHIFEWMDGDDCKNESRFNWIQQQGYLYKGMVHPLTSYTIRGVLWYQGEWDVPDYQEYTAMQTLMVRGWRKAFGQPNLPFLFVQLPNFATPDRGHIGNWPYQREAQLKAWQTIPNVAMVVTIDVGDPHNIHPAYKKPVGYRLALAARAIVYRQRVKYRSPVYQSMRIDGNQAIITFTDAEDGLVVKGDKLRGFTIAGTDGKFYDADAVVHGKTVILSSPQVTQPTAVRYGWADCPVVNLYNKADLPASPFRTDDK